MVIKHAHVECVLYYYGIPAFEVMTVVRRVSKASGRTCSIHWRVEHWQRAARRQGARSTYFDGMLGPLII
jgi:hypothetical protein